MPILNTLPVRAKALTLYVMLLFLLDSWFSGLKVEHCMYILFNTCAMS